MLQTRSRRDGRDRRRREAERREVVGGAADDHSRTVDEDVPKKAPFGARARRDLDWRSVTVRS